MKLYKMLRPGTFGDVSPNGDRAVVVDRKQGLWKIYVTGLAEDGSESEFKAHNWSPVVDIEWSRDSKYAVLIGGGPHSIPVLVGPGPKVTELKELAKDWRAESGAAFIHNWALAVVDASQRKILRVSTK